MVQTKDLNEQFCEKQAMLDLAIAHNQYMIFSFSEYGGSLASYAIKKWKAENLVYEQHQELLWKLIAPLRCEYSQQ